MKLEGREALAGLVAAGSGFVVGAEMAVGAVG